MFEACIYITNYDCMVNEYVNEYINEYIKLCSLERTTFKFE